MGTQQSRVARYSMRSAGRTVGDLVQWRGKWITEAPTHCPQRSSARLRDNGLVRVGHILVGEFVRESG